MPLYTYIVTYKGATHMAQDSHSNFIGFVRTWADGIPASALPSLTPVLRKLLLQRAYEGTFVQQTGATHVWKKSLELGGSELTVFAIQTER